MTVSVRSPAGILHDVAEQHTSSLEGPDTAQPTEPVQRITHAQAAALLGCHTSNVAKLVKKGHLASTGVRGPGGGTLDLIEVVALREERLHAEAERRLRYDRVDPQRARPPAVLGDHDWLSVPQVAARLGVTEQSVRGRAQRGTIPHTRHGKRIWVRADHLEVWMAARAAAGAHDVPTPVTGNRSDPGARSGKGDQPSGSYTTPAARWPHPRRAGVG